MMVSTRWGAGRPRLKAPAPLSTPTPSAAAVRPPPRRPHRAAAAAETGQPGDGGLITLEEVQAAACARGLDISVRTLGLAYRIVCRDAAGPAAAAAGPSAAAAAAGRVLAVTTGFVLPPPVGLMHCDALQVFTRGLGGAEGQRARGGALGLGLLVGGATFAWGLAAGCRKAEILAINDDDYGHARLVAYYRRFGFEPVREVTGGRLADLPHMLVWGGAGTRMDADVEGMLRRWGPAIRASGARAAAASGGGGGGGGGGAAEAAAAAAGGAGERRRLTLEK